MTEAKPQEKRPSRSKKPAWATRLPKPIDRPTVEEVLAMVDEASGVTEQQKLGIAVWLSMPPGTQAKEIAKQIGVCSKTFLRWRMVPAFMETYRKAKQALYAPVLALADATLEEAVQQDWRAALGVKRLEEAKIVVQHTGSIDVRVGSPNDFLNRLTGAERAEAESKGEGSG